MREHDEPPALEREERRHERTLKRLGYKHVKRGKMVRTGVRRRRRA